MTVFPILKMLDTWKILKETQDELLEMKTTLWETKTVLEEHKED